MYMFCLIQPFPVFGIEEGISHLAIVTQTPIAIYSKEI